MRNKESRLYRRIGVIVLISVVVVMLIGFFYEIPVDTNVNDCQQYTCQGISVKENSSEFKQFISSIKTNNGVLVLGSSETNAFGDDNYQGLLNKYFECGVDFSYLAGAGRTAHIYFPTLINNRTLFKGVKILYFINPTYWRESLNYYRADYTERYNSRLEVFDARDELRELNLYDDFGAPFLNDSVIPLMGLYINRWRDKFVRLNDLFFNIRAEEPVIVNKCTDDFIKKSIDSNIINGLMKELDPESNISLAFKEKDPKEFVKISDSEFQWKALKGFKTICDDIGVELVFVLGPYNGIYCRNNSPEMCEKHEEVLRLLKSYLSDSGSEYIDCSDLSYEKGSFIDLQHHSKYAAWIIASRISNYYEENH